MNRINLGFVVEPECILVLRSKKAVTFGVEFKMPEIPMVVEFPDPTDAANVAKARFRIVLEEIEP
jgi:hypothetical protein